MLSGTVSVVALLAAGWWFLNTTKFKPRIQFDIDCKFVLLRVNPEWLVAEIQLIFENKGFVEHRIHDLNLSVHQLPSEEDLEEREITHELLFKKAVFRKLSIVPPGYGFFFVRPGVRQVVTHTVRIPASVSVIRITAGFEYDRVKKNFPHTARRIFQTPSEPEG